MQRRLGGKRGTHNYRVYKKACMTAALAADTGRTQGRRQRRRHREHLARRHGLPRSVPAPASHKDRPLRLPRLRVGGSGCPEGLGGRPLTATLAGVAGDATTDQDGTGSATFTLNQGHGQICYDVTWSALDEVSGLHIHTVTNNAIVVPLDADTVLTDGSAKGCVNGIAKNLIKAIRQNPQQYYVNVHTNTYTAGAIRGTLQT